MTTDTPTMLEIARPGGLEAGLAPGMAACDFKKILTCFTRPGWNIVHGRDGCRSAPGSSLDAVVFDGAGEIDLAAAAVALKPLGRLIAVALWDQAEAIEASIRDAGCTAEGNALCVTSRLVLDDGRRVVVAERAGDAGCVERRSDAHPGAYKMSRYKAYHQMQSAVARLIPTQVRDVIEIGDSNGVIRDMLGGGGDIDYFRAHYPPHDLQTLHLVADQSRDVFICDNTLEHVADPRAAVRQMARVLRPGGWLVLFAPFIAMCQDDDRCRWSVRALGELMASDFDAGMLGGWGNVEAACWYMRANKWLRVVDQREGTLRCRDSRVDGSPMVDVPVANDRLHPIHVWAVARRAGGGGSCGGSAGIAAVPRGARLSSYLGLDLEHKPPTAALARLLGSGSRVLIAPGDDGSLADRLVELGLVPTTLADDAALATAVLSRGHACVPVEGVAATWDAVLLHAPADRVHVILEHCRRALVSCRVVMVLGGQAEVQRYEAALSACGLMKRAAQPASGSAIFTRQP